MRPELKTAIDRFVKENKVILFMKARPRPPPLPCPAICIPNPPAGLASQGTKAAPQCGFSNQCVQIFNSMGVPYETARPAQPPPPTPAPSLTSGQRREPPCWRRQVNILEDNALRSGMKEYSAWPTFPQVYIDGEFFGGCDITVAAFQDGSLKEVVEKALAS